jgi:hypothetical protein
MKDPSLKAGRGDVRFKLHFCGVAAEKSYQLVKSSKQLSNSKRHANERDFRVCSWSEVGDNRFGCKSVVIDLAV